MLESGFQGKMKKYKVLWTNTARLDLYRIIDFISQNNPKNAFAILNKLEKRANTLRTFPRRGRIPPEMKSIGVIVYREIIIKPWRLVYKVEEAKIHIMGLFDGRRDLEDILIERLLRN